MTLSMDIKIESSITDEKKQVFLDVVKESFRPLANEGHDCSCYRYTMQDFDDLVMANHHLFAFVNSIPAGLISSRFDSEKKYGYIIVIAVLPEYQKYGIGTLLAQRIIDESKMGGVIL